MKHIILFLTIFLSLGVFAQEKDAVPAATQTGKVRGDLHLGIGMPLYKAGAIRVTPMYSIGGELRYYFPNSAWDVGIGARGNLFRRIYKEGYPLYISSQHYLVVDYNYRVSSSLVLFAGLEGGISIAYDMSEYNSTANPYGIGGMAADTRNFYEKKGISPYFGPRVGLEVWNRLRATLTYGMMDKGERNVNFRMGYVF